MSTINWYLVYTVTSFTLAIIITVYSAVVTGLIIQQWGLHALLTSVWLHPFLAVFSALFTIWFVQNNALISFLATTSATLNALLI
jgi:hypothetical protein